MMPNPHSGPIARAGLFLWILSLASPPAAVADHILLQVENFDGPWKRQTNISGYLGTGFCTSNANPKIADTKMVGQATIQNPGRHVVWIRAYTSENSNRALRVRVGDKLLAKTHADAKRHWTWQRAGELDLPAGPIAVIVEDAADGFESADAILLTDKTDYDPMAQERRWLVFGGKKRPQADALQFVINACCTALEKRKAPASKAQWEYARKQIHQELAAALGLDPMPPKTPLNARVTGRAERETYFVENVLFESRPRFYVTANVYIPKNVKLPAPGVVVVPGHAMKDGKNYPLYQMAELGLVQQGFVVLGYDPIGQGERQVAGMGHNLGYGSLLVGQTNEGMIVWDTIRAIDYLVSRPEVNGKRIGLTGNSGGGENTFYAMPFDERITAGASFCFVCSYEQFLRHGGNHCICNHLPGIVHAMEEFEIIGLNVPRPFLFGNGAKDRIFPIKGVRQTHDWAKQIYGLYGVADQVTLVEVDLGHGWAKPLREACYGWLAKWLGGRGDGSPIPEPARYKHENPDSPDVLVLKDKKLPADAETIVTLNRKRADALIGRYAAPPSDKEAWLRSVGPWRALVGEVFGGKPPATTPTAERMDRFSWEGHAGEAVAVETLAITTEPGMEVAALLLRPAGVSGPCPAVVYVDEKNKESVRRSPVAAALLKAGTAVLAVDPRGMGETFAHENHLTSDTICLGRHIFGQRVWDVMQVGRYLAGREDIDGRRVGCYGIGPSGLLGIFAAGLGGPFESVAADRSLASFRFALEDAQPQPLWIFVPNLLKTIDLPQVAALASPKRILMANAVGYGRKPLAADVAKGELAFTAAAYKLAGSASRFSVITGPADAVNPKVAAFLSADP